MPLFWSDFFSATFFVNKMKIYKKWQIPLRDGGGVGGGGLIIDIMYSNAPNNVLSCAYVVKYSFPDRVGIKGHPVKS